MTFKQAVEATPQIALGFKNGLTALGKHSNKVSVSSLSLLQGSVDIDTCTTLLYPNDNRWDYAFAYNGNVYFIEVHSANTAEVTTLLRKLKWLKDWLIQHAPEIHKLKAKNLPAFYWVQSKGFAIPTNSPQYRRAIQANLRPIAKLVLK